MAEDTIKLQIPFQTLLDFVGGMNLENKRQLWLWLDAQIAQTEESLWEQNPKAQLELQEARSAYETGDFVSLDEYIEQQKDDAG